MYFRATALQLWCVGPCQVRCKNHSSIGPCQVRCEKHNSICQANLENVLQKTYFKNVLKAGFIDPFQDAFVKLSQGVETFMGLAPALVTPNLRGTAAANLVVSSKRLCLNSCLPMLGGPTRIIGRFWFDCGQQRAISSYGGMSNL